ncbi:hypothetical protein HELRODRAFT_168701 [Helobdella robusta]|uniref:Nucleoporin Nup133/Nup155-like N-terminal domain-containing protein n=1 Tax=Helobdella robusta TaxID=6412 RepID=T1F0V5_HELRO|nr:hypothetical protein HELRODRAFT_168701 [Helobdella robusta]ESO08795.1 hypothetical protein HELRODRAFT_168701 [Helobdella robusta]
MAFPQDAQDPFTKAITYLNLAAGADNSYYDMAALLGSDTFHDPTVSGDDQNDYPVLSFSTPQMAPPKFRMLPLELQEKLKHLQYNCQMGVFTEIGRAWLAVDKEFFLWTYEDGNDIAYFDGLNDVIVAAALVKPKPNIFQSHISHLLCLATTVEVHLLGVSFTSSSSSSPFG